MQRTIIAIWGKGGSGKSTTIAKTLAELQKRACESTVRRGNDLAVPVKCGRQY